MTTEPTYRRGDSGPAVAAIRERLDRLGLIDAGSIHPGIRGRGRPGVGNSDAGGIHRDVCGLGLLDAGNIGVGSIHPDTRSHGSASPHNARAR